MPSLTDLPNELLMEIASCGFSPALDMTSKSHHGLLNLILMSHQWRQVVEPYLYQHIHLSFRWGPCQDFSCSLILLICTLLDCPELSEPCRSLSLHMNLQDVFRNPEDNELIEIDPVDDIMTPVIKNDLSNNDRFQSALTDLGTYIVFLLDLLPKLDALIILNIPVFSIGCFAFNVDPKYGFQIPAGLQSITQLFIKPLSPLMSSLQYSFLPALVTLPSLRQLTLDRHRGFSPLHCKDGQAQTDLVGTSSLVSFHASGSNFTSESLAHILEIPIHLKSINLNCCSFLKFNMHLCSKPCPFGSMGSFAEFSQLQHLCIPCHYLLGKVPSPKEFSQHLDEFSHMFFTLLPTSLEELEVWIDRDWNPRTFVAFIGGAQNKATWGYWWQKHLPCLKRFVIHVRKNQHQTWCMSELELFGIEVVLEFWS